MGLNKKKWKAWAEILENDKIPNWDGLLCLDCSPAGELHEALHFLRHQPIPCPEISEYIVKRISAPALTYRSLNVEQKEIRLLKLIFQGPILPGRVGEIMPIECSMKHFSFNKCPEYYALSYAWGHEERQLPIIVDEQLLQVTPNLFSALLHFRSRGLREWLWIDAICINQTNDIEKSEQVQRMRSIYQGAMRVLAWVGPEYEQDERDDATLSKLKKISEAITEKAVSAHIRGVKTMSSLENGLFPKYQSIGCRRRPMIDLFGHSVGVHEHSGKREFITLDLDHFMEALSSNPTLATELALEIILKRANDSHGDARKIRRFFSQSIWDRIWILQEFASAREVILIYGGENLLLQHFFIVWVVLYHHVNQVVGIDLGGGWRLIDQSVKSLAPLLLQSKVLHNGRKPRSLFELLRATGGFAATDPRDKVFALLGIAEDTQQLEIYPDYSKPYRTLCTEVTKAMIQKYGLSILSFNAGLSYRVYGFAGFPTALVPEIDSLPSWCCDWTMKSYYTVVADRLPGHLDFSASGNCDTQAGVHFGSTLCTLSLTIVRVGTATIVRSHHHVDYNTDLIAMTSQLFSELEELELASQIQIIGSTEMELEEALFCIPIAYQKREGEAAGPVLQHAPQNLLEAYQILRKASNLLKVDVCAEEVQPYLLEVKRRALGKTLFACGSQYLGLGPWNLEAGDVLSIFLGANVPYVVRPLSNGNYQLVGEAYVHGIMYGEFIQNAGSAAVEVITLE